MYTLPFLFVSQTKPCCWRTVCYEYFCNSPEKQLQTQIIIAKLAIGGECSRKLLYDSIEQIAAETLVCGAIDTSARRV